MNRKAEVGILAWIFLAISFLTGCSGGSITTTTTTQAITITVTSGLGQSAPVNTPFAYPLVVTVYSNGSPVGLGKSVTFTAPASGASGVFTLTGTNTETVNTNADGVATSSTFTANATAGPYTVTASTSGATTNASFGLTNTGAPAITITATSGSGQSAQINQPFAAPLQATVYSGGSPVGAGVPVTFTAPATGASGVFATSPAAATDTETTDSNGVATSKVFTANATAGAYTVSASTTGAATPASFSLTNTGTSAITIAATSGSGQSTQVNTPFTYLLVATVYSGGLPVGAGVPVTFTAPASGPSGAFATSPAAATDTETTDSNGVATSKVFTANATAGAYTVSASTTGAATPASFNLTNTAPIIVVSTTSGSGQSTQVNQQFAAPLQATVYSNGTLENAGAWVTFTAPASGPSGTFASTGTATETVNTNANGVATSSPFTANATAGAYAVSASTNGATTPATFNLTNTAVPTYAFYLSGLELTGSNGTVSGPLFYALAGSVAIDVDGDVVGGELDFNDAAGCTVTDTIVPLNESFIPDSTGQGSLTLEPANTTLCAGYYGVIILGVQFVNSKHAIITQYESIGTSDGTETGSGSLDLQTLPSTSSTPSGNFAFTVSGVDSSYNPTVSGGVLSINAGALSGFVDTNDAGTVTMNQPFTGTVGAPDSYGRGQITGVEIAGVTESLVYYVVGPEAIRIMDVDQYDSSAGSAFGQGHDSTGQPNTFDNFSLGPSVFAIEGSPWDGNYAAVGSFTASPASSLSAGGTFSGIGDDDEIYTYGVVSGAAIAGAYSIADNGYGSLDITYPDLGDVSNLGMYMTDPNLDLLDPNNTDYANISTGGALLVDLDSYLNSGATLIGTGVVIPQTDTDPAGIASNLAFGGQAFYDIGGVDFWEYDFVGQGPFAADTLSGSGLLSDPALAFGEYQQTTNPITFVGTAIADTTESATGRYTMLETNTTPNPLVVTVQTTNFVTVKNIVADFDVVLYQASDSQLFWLEEEPYSLFLGPLEGQGSLTEVPGVD